MTLLQCPSWDPSSTRNELQELVEPKPICACWLGCVSLDDKAKFSEFMSSARSGNVQSLVQYHHTGGDMVYAVLLKLPEDRWKLVVILSCQEMWSDEEVMLSTIIHPEVEIKIYDSDRKAPKDPLD
jgi:hypothetical protein